MRILSVDPSNLSGGDPMAAVLLDSDKTSIYILGAKYWKQGDFTAVESEIAQIFADHKCQLLVIEKNSMGQRIAHSFSHEHNLPVQAVYTTASSKEQKTNTMDKMEHTNWLIKFSKNSLDWPKADSIYMKELKRQWDIFGEYHKGKLSAPPGTYVLRKREFSGTLLFLHEDELEDNNSLNELNRQTQRGESGIVWKQIT